MNTKKTKQQLQNDASKKLKRVDKCLAEVPAVPFDKCGSEGRRRWNDLADALLEYRTAVAIWRAAPDDSNTLEYATL